MKKLIIVIVILLVIASVTWLVYTKITVRVKFKADLYTTNNSIIQVSTPGANTLYTKDKNKINKVIKFLNSIKYFEGSKYKLPNESSDAEVIMYSKDGKDRKVVDKIEFYGDIAVYKNKRYKFMPWVYNGLENLCNSLSEK